VIVCVIVVGECSGHCVEFVFFFLLFVFVFLPSLFLLSNILGVGKEEGT